MVPDWQQLRLLLWKDLLIRRRKLVTLFGVVWACLVVGSLWVVRHNIDNQYNPTCQYAARALPSAGMLTFVQSFICNLDNKCTPHDQYEEVPTYENSRFTQIRRQFSPILFNDTIIEIASSVPDALKLLATLTRVVDEPTFIDVAKNGIKVRDLFTSPNRVKRYAKDKLSMEDALLDNLLNAQFNFAGIFSNSLNKCNSMTLSNIFVIEERVAVSLAESVCQLNNVELQKILFGLLPEINFSKYIKMFGDIIYRMTNDDSLSVLADSVMSVFHLSDMKSFIPSELYPLLKKNTDEFHYFNLTLIPKLLDLFEPTFGNSDSFKTIQELAGGLVSGVQWIYKLYANSSKTTLVDDTKLILGNVRMDGVDVGAEIVKAVDVLEGSFKTDSAVNEVFNVLSKVTSFMMKYLPARTQHEFLLYSTLFAKLIEGAHRVVLDNIRIESIVYNVSRRNMEAVNILTELPSDVLSHVFDALTHAYRIELLTSRINDPGKLFCDVNKLQSFLQLPADVVAEVKNRTCNDVWKKYVTDLINSFGINDVKKNINVMASILIQETIGKDTSSQLYTIDKDFEIVKDFTQDLIRISSETTPEVDWAKLFNVTQDAEIMKVIRCKQNLGKLILITVHGAFAHEIVKQNTILDIKISPILIDATAILVALNKQLKQIPATLVDNFKSNYEAILKTMLYTLMDEERTLKSLSTYAVDIFCNGMDNSTKYIIYPVDTDKEAILDTLCRTSMEIEKALTSKSIIGKAIRTVMSSKPNTDDEIDWTTLITSFRNLYKTLSSDYPYIFDYTNYGVRDKQAVDVLLSDVKQFWFGRSNVSRTVQLSLKFCLQFLDLLDQDIFNITNGNWVKFKYVIDSTNGYLVVADQIMQLFIDLHSPSETLQSELPHSSVIAMKDIIPNVPQLIMDTANIIMEDKTELKPIIELMNESPQWPCSNKSLSDYLTLTNGSIKAVKGMERIFCMDTSFQKEWIDYIDNQNIKINMSLKKANTTMYRPHMFLKFSLNFGNIINHVSKLKIIIEDIVSDNTTAGNKKNIVTAWNYVRDVLNNTNGEVKIRSLLNKIDTVLNSVMTADIDNTPLYNLWRTYTQCSDGTILNTTCRDTITVTWKNMIKFSSVIFEQAGLDLLTYFNEVTDPNANLLQMIGFTKSTGLYILYDKLADFAGVLLNSYWDYGFMNQIRRASKSEFWDCEAVVDALVIPPGSRVTYDDIHKLKPYVCPSFIYWISLPTGENTFLNIVAKPQYYFYSIPAKNLTSVFESAYINMKNLTTAIEDYANKNITINKTATDLNSIGGKFEEVIDNIMTWKLTDNDASYRLFNEINKKQFISSIYLTRIVIIVNKIYTTIDNIDVNGIQDGGDLKKLETDLNSFQRIFKRRPSEAVSIHFDIITDLLWKNDFNIINGLNTMCENFKNNISRNILNDGVRVKNQICSKDYKLFYANISLDDELKMARDSLMAFVNSLQTNISQDDDLFEFLNQRKELVTSIKLATKYADDLGLPIHLKYLHSNLRHFNIILSFLSGDDWWAQLKDVYKGEKATIFFEVLENSVDITENILTHLDKIHLVRLIRDININSTEMFCLDNLTLSDYIPDSSALLSKLKTSICHSERTQLFKELPQLVLVSQGYDSELKLSKELNYTSIEQDLANVENKLQLIRNGPKTPKTPSWITEEKLSKLKMAAVDVFSKETITKMTFGVISNIVDGSILFFNNSHCPLCSTLTTWFKQLHLQLFKKQEYDTLLCNLNKMTYNDIYHTLKNDFHWDMAIKELISTRNYTRYELNKSINEFLDQLKVHLLEDITSNRTKLSRCLASNVTMNAFGNASLLLSVVSHSLILVDAMMPHIKDVAGIEKVPLINQLASDVIPKLRVRTILKNVIANMSYIKDQLNDDLFQDVLEGSADLYLLKYQPNTSLSEWLFLNNNNWTYVCTNVNCTQLHINVRKTINATKLDSNLKTLQTEKFWSFSFISDIIRHLSNISSDISRLLGVASKMDVSGIVDGRLSSVLDSLLQLIQEDVLNDIIYSLDGISTELHPLFVGSQFEFDLLALKRGLQVVHQFRDKIISDNNIKVYITPLFSNPDRLESELSLLGINNTNFWSLAAPRIHRGHIDFKPLLTLKSDSVHISNFVCNAENMSKIIKPANIDVVTLDDVYDAVIEQFCGLPDERVKDIVPVILENLNFTYIFNKVVDKLLAEVYSSSNLTKQDGAAVISKFPAMMSLLPTIQNSVANLTDVLAKEPMFEALKKFDSLGGLLGSAEFLTSAGNMLCGKPFVGNTNRFYKTIAETPDFTDSVDPLQLESLPTDYCRDLYKDVIRMNGGKIIWNFIKPLLMGKILFTPNIPTVMNIIQNANASFVQMSKLTTILHKFASSFHSINDISDHKQGVSVLRSVINSTTFKQLSKSLIQTDNFDMTSSNIDLDELFDNFGDFNDIGKLLQRASNLLGCINLNRFHAMDDEDKLSNEAVKLTRVNEFSAGVVFENIKHRNNIPLSVEYKIRMDIDSVPTTTRLRNQFWTPGPEGSFLEDMRYFRGFIQIQDMIDKAIILASRNDTGRVKRETRDNDIPNWSVYTQQMPYPCYMRDYFQSSLYESQALIVAFFFAFIMSVASAVRFIVAEKETGNTLLMSIMGVRLVNHTLSWFLTSLVEMLITVTGAWIVLRVGGVLAHSDAGMVWLLLANYGLSVLMFCYLISKLFSTASVGSVCACLFLLFSFMPYVIILSLEATLTLAQKIVTCLSMSTAFSYSMLLVGRYEAIGTGLQWSHVWASAPGEEGINIASTTFMVLMDTLLYFIIGCIIDRYFGIKTLRASVTNIKTTSEKAGVSILNVTKIYGAKSRKPKLALDNVSIELHKGQITTLLGQNGAGKTTLIKIITGMLKPTKGSVIIRSDASLPSVPGVGVCPQNDVLFHNLTAYEHLCLYHQLKVHTSDSSYLKEVQSMLEVLSFGALAHEQTYRLSGGLRRRLCVALAFISNPGLVLLDEPSSGVDPVARRDIWSLIMKLKNQRTVFLTTHHLDEAELLSDQIVIMHKGQIHTIGSPVEIKRSLGNGYKLSVTYPERNPRSLQDMKHIPWDDHEEGQAIDIEERSKALLTTVRAVVKNAQLLDVCDCVVEVTLPFFDAQGLNNNFLELFSTLEQHKSTLEYRALTVECDSLEQVMSNICNQQPPAYAHTNDQFDIPSKSGSSSSLQNDVTPLVTADGPIRGTHWNQYCALLHKRWTHYIRNRWLLLLLVVLPTLFVTISMGFSLIRPPYDNEIRLRLHPDIYKDTTKFVVLPNADLPENRMSYSVLNSLINKDNAVNWTPEATPQCKCEEFTQSCANHNASRSDVTFGSARALNEWIVNTQLDYIQRRYGGWSSSRTDNKSNLIAWYNNKGHHAMPAYVNQLNSHIMKTYSGQPKAEIITHTHPLKISEEQLSKSTLLQHVADVGIAAMLLLAYSLIPAGAVIYIVHERISQQKRLQLLCGVEPSVYWLAAITWDMFIVLINIILTACVLLAFNLPVFVDKHNLPAICLLLLLFGFSCTSLTHLLEKLFSESSMANMILFCGNVFTGASGLAILLIMDIIAESDATVNARWVLHKIFLLSPQFALGDALVEIAKNTVQAQVLSRFGMVTYASPFTTSLISYHYIALFLVGILLMSLNLAIENYLFDGLLHRLYKEPSHVERANELEELDVSAERRRVEASMYSGKLRISTIGRINAGYVDHDGSKQSIGSMMSDDVAACVRVTKTYSTASGHRTAVAGLSLAVPRGQCTALLGENGAGKSSTFAMLCGELTPTSGKIVLNHKIATRKDLCTGYVSYCPQSDAIDPLMTVRQTLMFYCKLRGIDDEDQVIKRTVTMFDLSKYTEYQNIKLSGGNKRKLSTAIAFMSRSTLILLDEPTSGMDPCSRSSVWRGVRSCWARGGAASRGVLLSTHILADSAAHAHKMALIKQGTLVMVSNMTDSRERWCGGYVVQCRIGSDSRASAWRSVLMKLPHAKIRALHVNSMQFLVPTIATVDEKQCRTELSDIFRAMVSLQGECDIEDYTITQSSLDQIFLSDKEEEQTVILEPLPTHINSDHLDTENVTAL